MIPNPDADNDPPALPELVPGGGGGAEVGGSHVVIEGLVVAINVSAVKEFDAQSIFKS